MAELPPEAVSHLWVFLSLFAAVGAAIATLIGGLWLGFKWLRTQMKEVFAESLRTDDFKKTVRDIVEESMTRHSERLALVERTADAAHRRIDELIGRRP